MKDAKKALQKPSLAFVSPYLTCLSDKANGKISEDFLLFLNTEILRCRQEMRAYVWEENLSCLEEKKKEKEKQQKGKTNEQKSPTFLSLKGLKGKMKFFKLFLCIF